MLTLAPTFARRRAPTRLIRDCHYVVARRISSTPPNTLSPASPGVSPIAGTAPHHTAYVLLHAHLPPAEYPPRSRSPLWRALTVRAQQWGGLVNFVWSPALRAHPAYTGIGEDPEARREQREVYTASVFSAVHRYGRLEIPEVSLANLDEVDEKLRRIVGSGSSGGGTSAQEVGESSRLDRRLHLYVCTHGSRDCRCGEGGGEVARALRRELDAREIGSDTVVLGEVAHVGGHKYAANVLVYPYGDWLGMVQDFDVPRILDEILAWHAQHQPLLAHSDTAHAQELPPMCPPFWRGRMGLDKQQQLSLMSRAG